MKLEEKLNLLKKNMVENYKEKQRRQLSNKYDLIRKLYNKVESDLQDGDIRIMVTGEDERKLASKYFTDENIACFGDCITQYTFEMTEKGIKKLEQDYLKVKEEYDSYE